MKRRLSRMRIVDKDIRRILEEQRNGMRAVLAALCSR